MAAKSKKNTTKTGLIYPVDDAWIFNRKPSQHVRALRGRVHGPSGETTLPEFLSQEDFEILDGGEMRAALGSRSAEGEGSNLKIHTEIDEDDRVFLIARRESEAISFHFPQRLSERRLAQTSGRVTLTFKVPLAEGISETERRGPLSLIVRVLLVKIIKTVVGNVIENAAKPTVPFLARKLEQQLWEKRTQGWLRVGPELAATEDRLRAGKPRFIGRQRGLLLIHGTFSTAFGAFKSLARTSFLSESSVLYGANVYAFNHFTISKTPAENVKDMLDSLPEQDFEFDIITHSRGGLVARELLEGSGLQHPKRKHLKIRNLIMVACPNNGTLLGSPSHWEGNLSLIANLLEMLPIPENPFTTAAAWLAESLKWIASNILGNCSGLVAMDPTGEYIANLRKTTHPPVGTQYHALVSNFHPRREWWARLSDMGIDNFFGEANDLVVPTIGGWITSDTLSTWIPDTQVACFGLGGNLKTESNIHHGTFFGNADTVTFLLSCLRGKPWKLTSLDLRNPLPSRTTRLSGNSFFLSANTGAYSKVPLSKTPTKLDFIQPDSMASIVATTGWSEEQELWLTVVSNDLHTKVEHERSAAVPMLIAQYGSARVAVPFYTHGTVDYAGQRWQRIIPKLRQLVRYANGEQFVDGKLAPGQEDGFPDEPFLRNLGDELFRTLFPGEVRTLYNVARFLHKKRRLKIIFTSMIPWVADIPWELAYDVASSSFLACGDVRFVRNVLTPTPSNRIEEKQGSLRILVVSAQPSGMGRLSIEDERRGIYESFRPLIDAGLVHVEVLAGASPSLLQERLRYQVDGDDFDVLHFIGHGEFDESSKTGYLLFEDEVGRPKSLSASSFLNILRGRDIRVVFLNACETGRGKQADYNRGVAMELMQDGIPAVVANQYSVIDRSASLFSLHFYACLASGLKIGDAMREARIALQYNGVEPMDWVVPVLFANNPDARLCKAISRKTTIKDQDGGFGVLSRPKELRRVTGVRRINVSVWDAENSLIYRENMQGALDEFNEAQESFAFRLERFTSPRGVWAVDPSPACDGIAYLRADRVVGRMERIRKSIGSEFLFCVTELPLRDDSIQALYYYVQRRISILSTWDLDPPLEGIKLRKAVANHLAMTLLYDLCAPLSAGDRDDDPEHPIHTVGFWNNRRDVAHIAGNMKVAGKVLSETRLRISSKKITTKQFESIKALLALYG